MAKEDDRREEILEEIDGVIAPDEMSQADALDWLEEMAASISARIDAIKEDMGGES